MNANSITVQEFAPVDLAIFSYTYLALSANLPRVRYGVDTRRTAICHAA